jgi:hypothetical protein
MIYLTCGCKVTRKGNTPKVEDRCLRHETEPYTPADWKGFQQRGPETERVDWMEVYDNYG